VTAVSKTKPQVIDDEDHERVHERVAAADVAKDSGMVCARTPHPSRPGARRSTVWTVKARMGAVRELGRQLKRDGIEVVTLESTPGYWRIWFFALEAAGLAVQLVNAAQARNLPGRPETDKLDAMWLARLTELGLLRASFVPPKAIRDLRDYTRMRTRLTQERTRCWQRLEKLLEGALVKLSSAASKLTTVSAQDMIKAMIAGPVHPGHRLAPAGRPRDPVHRPRLRLLPGPHRYRPQAPQPHPADPSTRLRRDRFQGRVTHTAPRPGPITASGPGPLPRAHLPWFIFRSATRTVTGHASALCCCTCICMYASVRCLSG
jgi:hypothetical protein